MDFDGVIVLVSSGSDEDHLEIVSLVVDTGQFASKVQLVTETETQSHILVVIKRNTLKRKTFYTPCLASFLCFQSVISLNLE